MAPQPGYAVQQPYVQQPMGQVMYTQQPMYVQQPGYPVQPYVQPTDPQSPNTPPPQ